MNAGCWPPYRVQVRLTVTPVCGKASTGNVNAMRLVFTCGPLKAIKLTTTATTVTRTVAVMYVVRLRHHGRGAFSGAAPTLLQKFSSPRFGGPP